MTTPRGWVGCAAVAFALAVPATAKAEKGDLPLAIGLGVAGGVAGLIGGGFMIAAEAFNDSADEQLAELSARGYGVPCLVDRATCVSIDEDLEAYDDATVGAVASFITGGVFLTGMVALFIKYGTEPKSGKAEVELLPIITAEAGGVCATISF